MVILLRSPRLAAGLLLAVFAGVGHMMTQGAAPAARLAIPAPPAQVGVWAGRALPVEANDALLTEGDNDIAIMEYRTGQEPPVWWLRVASLGDRSAFHPPELCYVGNQFTVLERGPIAVEVAGQPRRLMRLVIGAGKHRYEVWYWFTANGRVTDNYYWQQLWLAREALDGRPVSGTLMRISTPLAGADVTRHRLLAFLRAFESVRSPVEAAAP